MVNFKKQISFVAWLLATSLMINSAGTTFGVEVPTIFGSHMVMQREIERPVWGWGEPGEKISIIMAGTTMTTTADAHGDWMVRLPALTDKGPYKMTITGKNTLEFEDILIGEVWLCSGQSNMEMGLENVKDGPAEVANADYPEMRLFKVKDHRSAGTPQNNFPDCQWHYCISRMVRKNGWGGFSATGYYFGRSLHKKLDVPVGLIDSSWGGTRIEPWTPLAGFEKVESLNSIVEAIKVAPEKNKAEINSAILKYTDWLPKAQAAAKNGELVPTPPAWPTPPATGAADPVALYNGMIHPLVPFAIRGAIWYQGESNCKTVERAEYKDKMTALIQGWRSVWGQGDFPFYYVQLAPFNYAKNSKNRTNNLPWMWEAQANAQANPNTGMVVTSDLVDDLQDIHPINKKDVGERLALWALAKTYNHNDIDYSGPVYKQMKIEGDKIRIEFNFAEGLQSRDNKELTWFEIAGANKIFVKADAVIDSQTNTVLVSNPSVKTPVAVRFAWDNLAQPNLINNAKLPAGAFRTDNWEK